MTKAHFKREIHEFVLSFACVQSVNLAHLIWREHEIKYVDVFCQMFFFGCHRENDVTILDVPSENNLGSSLVMSSSKLLDNFIFFQINTFVFKRHPWKTI